MPTNSDTIEALNSILISRNINMNKDINDIKVETKMPKLLIANNEEITSDVMVKLSEVEKDAEYIGSKRKIIDLSTLMATFIRDTKAQNITVKDIYLCYFYNSTQVEEKVKYAEAEPAWVIETGNEKYIYSAYTGNFSKTI
jgi:hypothetical protein